MAPHGMRKPVPFMDRLTASADGDETISYDLLARLAMATAFATASGAAVGAAALGMWR